ncbi:MAG: hypothetical protein ACOC0N_11810 [Chroococcales cyanobacterium]
MKTINCLTSACWSCRFYQPEGRRGGMCNQLGVPVSGQWKACQLAIPVFQSTLEKIKQEIVLLEQTLTLDCPAEYLEIEVSEQHVLVSKK